MAEHPKVIIRLDPSKINPFIQQVTDLSAHRAARRVAARAGANVRAKDRVRTGAMAKSFTAKQARNRRGQFTSSYEVTNPLSYFVHQEEGVRPFRPVRAKVLRFKPKGSSVFIFRPWVRGFPGGHFLRDAYRSLGLKDFLP